MLRTTIQVVRKPADQRGIAVIPSPVGGRAHTGLADCASPPGPRLRTRPRDLRGNDPLGRDQHHDPPTRPRRPRDPSTTTAYSNPPDDLLKHALTPASDDELTTRDQLHRPPPVCWAHERSRLSLENSDPAALSRHFRVFRPRVEPPTSNPCCNSQATRNHNVGCSAFASTSHFAVERLPSPLM
jgi:hypothetical protein